MADVLLTHSYHLPYDRKQVRKMQPYAPLGTLFAATALRRSGVSVAVFDTMLLDPKNEFGKALEQHTPQIVVIYEDDFNFLSKMCLTRMREVAWELARQSREAGAVVIAHGSDATDRTEDYLGNGVDYVLCGEAEATLTELCTLLLKRDCAEGVAGLRRLNERGALAGIETSPPKNPSWTGLAAPSRELIDLEPYRRAWKTAHGHFSANVVASRGCPYRCNWCAKPISGNKYQLRAAAKVAAEIRELKELYGGRAHLVRRRHLRSGSSLDCRLRRSHGSQPLRDALQDSIARRLDDRRNRCAAGARRMRRSVDGH